MLDESPSRYHSTTLPPEKPISPPITLPRRTSSSTPGKQPRRIEVCAASSTGADYGVGSAMPQIIAEDAVAALNTAERFIDCIAALLV